MQAAQGHALSSTAPSQKPLRSSLKAKAPLTPSRGTDAPVASTSKSANGGSRSPLPSFSLAAPSPTEFSSPHFAKVGPSAFETPVTTPTRSEASKGKRKADDLDVTPPDQKAAHKATFAIPEPRVSHKLSNTSRAPSSYKRARLSSPLPSIHSQFTSVDQSPSANAQNTGTYSSRTSSRARRASASAVPSENASERRRSLSQVSIPISALVTPHAASIGRSSTFRMRDPRRPTAKKLETGWALRFHSEDENGSPRHAWLFYLAFVLFPLWWVASFLPTPQTRVVGDTDTEKAVTLDDPQIEFDAKTWRKRCRVMAVISLFTYIPFIVCIGVFA
ncbi:hypothetical protein FA95DRAFT_1507464 [Auriscalpium vulgare]|uniref:Uncharacterized protein n=1 Tax=Auriscalpium vulgare TaxID=40419 RepID=A0ACB8SBV5_9AGAM|nr:hypothetical protein FA95DRAFT_1507464 [Auriscalpium vulgare]